MTSLSPISFCSRIRVVTFLQTSMASSQVTISTELRLPFHLLAFLPVTSAYSSWVTSYFAMAKGALNVTLTAGFSAAGAVLVDEPISNEAGNLPLPGFSSTNSSANSLRMRLGFFSSARARRQNASGTARRTERLRVRGMDRLHDRSIEGVFQWRAGVRQVRNLPSS